MNYIYIVTAIVAPEHPDRWPGESRGFGWFETHYDAKRAVRTNDSEMHECLYTHIVIERSFPGIHGEAKAIYWAAWSLEERRWKRCKRPEWSAQIVNWAIG